MSHCLAVCDAWNNRIVFLSLDGSFCGEWVNVGGIALAEVSDIRFLEKPKAAGLEAEVVAYWLVLDRGNHRLCALGLDGEPLFQVGRPLSPTLTAQWPLDTLRLLASGLPQVTMGAFRPFDPLYYPTRFVGRSETSLFVWEPLSRLLKQVLLGNLFPIRLSPPSEEWIAADEACVLGWCPEPHLLRIYGSDGELCCECTLDGTPVYADLISNELWMQQEDQLRRCELDIEPALQSESERLEAFMLLRRTAEKQIAESNLAGVQAALEGCFRASDALIEVSDRVVHAISSGGFASLQPDALDAEMNRISDSSARARANLCPAVHHRYIGTLELTLLRALAKRRALPDSQIAADGQGQRHELNLSDITQFLSKFPHFVERVDDLFLARSSLPASTIDQDRIIGWKSLVERLLVELGLVIDWCYVWSGAAGDLSDYLECDRLASSAGPQHLPS